MIYKYGKYSKMINKIVGRERTRFIVRLRDKFTCQTCSKRRLPSSKKRQFDVHHINGLCGKMSRKYDRVEDIDTMITLCHKCHYKHHKFMGYEKRNQNGHTRMFDRDEAQDLRNQGFSLDAIAEQLDVSQAAISQGLKVHRSQ